MDIGTIVVLVILIAPIGFAVGVYNKREQFPNNTVAGTFNFFAAQLLEVESEEVREAPKISFT